jgi:hypothetical protein
MIGHRIDRLVAAALRASRHRAILYLLSPYATGPSHLEKAMPFTNTEATAYGLLAMYAMDMYRVQQDPRKPPELTPPPAPGLVAAGWSILAYITGKDSLLPETPPKGPLPLIDQTVYCGYLAQRTPGEMVAVIRGTDGFVEWVEDAEFLPVPYAPRIALPAGLGTVLVEQGKPGTNQPEGRITWPPRAGCCHIGGDGGHLGDGRRTQSGRGPRNLSDP